MLAPCAGYTAPQYTAVLQLRTPPWIHLLPLRLSKRSSASRSFTTDWHSPGSRKVLHTCLEDVVVLGCEWLAEAHHVCDDALLGVKYQQVQPIHLILLQQNGWQE